MSASLAAAHAIARGIAAQAIHHAGVCTWIEDETLGPDLYGGTAGVGLVLAEIGAATDDETLRATAAAALRHAIGAAGEVPLALAMGLFTGRLGIGLAAVRGGMIARDEALVAAGEELLLALVASDDDGPRHDLVGGRAGALVGLLAASIALGRPALAVRAADLGDALVGAAEIDGDAWSWPHPTVAAHANLSGLSHGAAGIGHALWELHAATGEVRFRTAAQGAIAYERGRFHAASGNWPDDRDLGPSTAFAPRSRIAWCHGAPGIALARHRAWELTGDEACRGEAAAGVMLTARWLRAALRTDRASFCLCHGLAGNAEIVRRCSDALADGDARIAGAVVERVAELGLQEYLDRVEPWPCGTPGGEPPGLMLGTAGIARFYLGRHDPGMPALLLPSPALAVF